MGLELGWAMAYPTTVSYHLPSPRGHNSASSGFGASPPESEIRTDPDVARTLAQEVIRPMRRERGWVAVPTYDMREYVKSQVITGAIGFGIGVTIGAVIGNIFKKTGIQAPGPGRLLRNPRRRLRRTSARQRRRGRPTPEVVRGEGLVCRIAGQEVQADIDARGHVSIGDTTFGTVYDFGTYFRAVPFTRYDASPRNFTTLAGAVKYLARQQEQAA